MKYTTETFHVDGARVELTRVPVRTRDYSFRNDREGNPIPHPEEQALYEIRIDGEHVGMAARPHGFGRQAFRIERLGGHVGSWQMGDLVVYGAGYLPDADRLYGLDQVATKAAALRKKTRWGKLKRLMPLDQIKRHMAEERARARREEAEAEMRRAQWAREHAEQKARDEQRRCDEAEGLRSINERLRSQLTNFESSALEAAIARLSPS